MQGVALAVTNPAEVGYLAAILHGAWVEHCGNGDERWRAVAEAAVLFFVPPPPALVDVERQEEDVAAVLRFARHHRETLLKNGSGRRLMVLARYIHQQDVSHRFL